MFKVGDEVIDGEGNEGIVIIDDLRENYHPIVARMTSARGEECVRTFTENGCFIQGRGECSKDIKLKPKTVWVNVNKTKEGMYFISAAAHKTENEARLRKCSESYVTTIELPA
jgi:hypothetical protein